MRDWIEINIYEVLEWPEGAPFYSDSMDKMRWCGRVYERKCYAYRLTRLATGRVTKHAVLSPGRTYIGLVSGIGEVARAKITA